MCETGPTDATYTGSLPSGPDPRLYAGFPSDEVGLRPELLEAKRHALGVDRVARGGQQHFFARKLSRWQRIKLRFTWSYIRQTRLLLPLTMWWLNRKAEQRYGQGTTADWINLAHFFADELLERWHDGKFDPDDCSVASYMGLSDEEYAMWAEGRYHDLAMALREREA